MPRRTKNRTMNELSVLGGTSGWSPTRILKFTEKKFRYSVGFEYIKDDAGDAQA